MKVGRVLRVRSRRMRFTEQPHLRLSASDTMSSSLFRCSSPLVQRQPHQHIQIRHATLLRRPKRPYTFTQLITLSDGSTFLHRTTSPLPVYRSSKDTRNNVLWNPSSQKLLNVEEDEAGRLRAFRARFGRGWDAEAVEEGEQVSLTASLAFE